MGSLAGLVFVIFSGRREQSAIPVAGILIAAATLWAMPSARSIPRSLLLGLALLAIAGLVSSRLKQRTAWGIALAIPGAYFTAFRADMPGPPWISLLAFGAIVLGSAFVTDFDRRHPGLAAFLLAMTLGGVFLTVPDTEEILVLLGAALPVLLLAWPMPLVRFGFGIFPLVGILIWALTWGGRGREGSIVGAVGCLGVLLVEPLAALIGRRTVRLPGRGIAALHLMLVLIGARIAGLRENPVTGASIAALALVIGTACCWILIRRADPRIRT